MPAFKRVRKKTSEIVTDVLKRVFAVPSKRMQRLEQKRLVELVSTLHNTGRKCFGVGLAIGGQVFCPISKSEIDAFGEALGQNLGLDLWAKIRSAKTMDMRWMQCQYCAVQYWERCLNVVRKQFNFTYDADWTNEPMESFIWMFPHEAREPIWVSLSEELFGRERWALEKALQMLIGLATWHVMNMNGIDAILPSLSPEFSCYSGTKKRLPIRTVWANLWEKDIRVELYSLPRGLFESVFRRTMPLGMFERILAVRFEYINDKPWKDALVWSRAMIETTGFGECATYFDEDFLAKIEQFSQTEIAHSIRLLERAQSLVRISGAWKDILRLYALAAKGLAEMCRKPDEVSGPETSPRVSEWSSFGETSDTSLLQKVAWKWFPS